MFFLGWLAACVVAVALIVWPTLKPQRADSSETAPTCRALALDDVEAPVTCRTAAATLTIAGERRTMVIGPTELRVLRSELSGDSLAVRVRLLNRTATKGTIRRQLYLRVGLARVAAPAVAGAGATGRAVTLRFRLPAAAARRLAEGEARAELGVVPADQVGRARPARLGVVRLDPA